MKKLSKKMISILLSVLMVVTAIPLGAFTVQAVASWTPIASSDFSSVSSVSQDTAFTPSTYNNMGNAMTWTPHAWTGNGNPSVDSANGAIAIPDGYMYLSGYSGGCVPITGQGAQGWKLDLGFRFYTTNSGDDKYYNSDNYSFLKMYVFTDDLSNPAQKNNAYCYFAQNANGVGYSWESDNSVGSQSQATSITTDNGNLVKDTNYHYVAEYTVNRFRAYITDDNGKIVQLVIDTTNSTFLNRLAKIGPYAEGNDRNVRINSIKLGDDDNEYFFKGLEYRNITFYSGSTVSNPSTNPTEPNNSNDKFLMAYFTGNYNLDNESLRYAVSDDGINYHTLNRGMPVTEINIPASGEGLTVYPTGGATGAWSTGHVRDPFILRKQDGTGFYILATDLDTATHGFNLNSKMLVWEVEKLEDIRTTQPWAIDVCGLIGSYTRRAWAPEAIWDAAKGKYMLHFSIQADGIDGTHLYYIYTSDFKTFEGTPKRLINPNTNNIDASITYNADDDLYYMWYKNESNATIAYATSPDACGPYTGSTPFAAGSVEGPEVFKNLDGNYVLLCDEYGAYADPGKSKQGVFKAFISNSITGFSTATNTNIPYLYARHAGVIRITNAEYNALINAFGGMVSSDKVEYFFTGNTSAVNKIKNNNNEDVPYGDGWLGSVKDPAEHIFKVSFSRTNMTDSYSASGGVLTLNKANVFMQDDDLRDMLKSNAFTVNFKCKITDAANLSSDIPIVTVGNNTKDYIRLTTSGKFYVNGQTVNNAVSLAANTEYEFTLSYNGATVSLFKDGEYVTGLVLDDTVVDPAGAQCYLSLGWTDTCGIDRTNKICAQYYDLSVTGTAIETGNKDSAVVEDYIENSNMPATIDAMKEVKQSSGDIYFGTSAVESGYYSNILYASRQTEYYGDTKVGYHNSTNNKRIQMRVSYPSVTAFYDGTNAITIPCILGTKTEDSASNDDIFPNLAYIGTDDFTVKGKWKGWDNGFVWTAGNTEYIGYKDTEAENQWIYFNNYQPNNNNTERSMKSYFKYTGDPGTTRLTTINGTTWYFGANTDSEYADNSVSSKYTSWQGQNMVIRIINVSDLTAVVEGLKNGTLDEYNRILSDNNYYTPQSTTNYLRAIKKLSALDVNSYFSMSTTDADGLNNYSDCVTAVNSVMTEYNLAKANLVRQYEITYNDYHGTKLDSYYYPTGTSGAYVKQYAPDLTNSADYDENNHYTYTWDNTSFGSVGVKATYTPKIATSTPHSWGEYAYAGNDEHTGYCHVNDQDHQKNFACDYSVAQTHTAAQGDTNGYTDNACSVCSHIGESARVWDDCSAEWAAYHSLADVVDTKASSGVYTTSSSAAYKAASDAVTNTVARADDETKSQSYINAKVTALTNAARLLNERANFGTLDSTVASKQAARNTNNYTAGGSQINTFDSWMAFYNAFENANAYYTKTAEQRADTPKYAVDGNNYVTAEFSSDQQNIDNYTTVLLRAGLTTVDTDENYEPFDYANIVANNVDTDKYTNAAAATFKTAKTNAYNAAYHKLTAEDYAAYNAATGRSFPIGEPIKNSNNVSVQTTNLLNAMTTLNSHIKQLWVTLTIQNEDGSAIDGVDTITYSPITYGASQELKLPVIDALSGMSVDKWSITNYSYTDNHEDETAIGSSKLSGVNDSFTKVVTNNIAVVAVVSKTNAAEGSTDKKVVINDIYNHIKSVYYVPEDTALPSGNALGNQTISVGTNAVTADKVPFYTFTKWTMRESGGAYIFRPHYTVAGHYAFGAVGGSVSQSEADYDTRIYLTYNASIEDAVESKNALSDVRFVAWAVKTQAGKYQIASYEQNYSFFACTGETFVPILDVDSSDANTYKAVLDNNGTLSDELTAAVIDADIPNYGDIQANTVLQYKLDNQLPFIAVQRAEMANPETIGGEEKFTKVRVFARVTKGAQNIGGFGVIVLNQCAEGDEATFTAENARIKRTITNILSTGQFTYTLNNANGFNDPVGFRGFVNYDIAYQTTTVNAIEYSNGARATV